ncbi:MAG: type II toxin-antitoxin system HicB family antitoxin [Bacteroidota bacterium]
MRQVIIYPGEDDYWVAECPSLPGCISQGKTKEETIANIKEAIQGYIAALEEDQLAIPLLTSTRRHRIIGIFPDG